MKAISLKQPWAWAIFHGKPVENRTRPWKHIGPVLIHASKKFDFDGYVWISENWDLTDCSMYSFPDPQDFRLICGKPIGMGMGGIVGKVNMVNCVTAHPSPWFFGPYSYVFENPEPMGFIKMPGKLGIFNVDIGG